MSSMVADNTHEETRIINDIKHGTENDHYLLLRKLQGRANKPKFHPTIKGKDLSPEQIEENRLYQFVNNILRNEMDNKGNWDCRVEPPSDTTGIAYLIHLTQSQQVKKICYDEKNWEPYKTQGTGSKGGKKGSNSKKVKKKGKKGSLRSLNYYIKQLDKLHKSIIALACNTDTDTDTKNMKIKCTAYTNNCKNLIDRIKQDEEKHKEEEEEKRMRKKEKEESLLNGLRKLSLEEREELLKRC